MASNQRDYHEDERNPPQFDRDQMSAAIYGGAEIAERNQRFAKIIGDDPIFRKGDQAHMGRVELFERALEKSRHVIVKQRDMKLQGTWA